MRKLNLSLRLPCIVVLLLHSDEVPTAEVSTVLMSMRLMTKTQYRHVRNYNYPATEQAHHRTHQKTRTTVSTIMPRPYGTRTLKSWRRHTSLASGCRSWRRADLVLDLGDQAGYCGDGSIPHVPLATTSRKDGGGSMNGGGAGCDSADNDARTMAGASPQPSDLLACPLRGKQPGVERPGSISPCERPDRIEAVLD
jgi:hypothetical protein